MTGVEAHALMRGRPFATLVTSGSEGLTATHLPTVLKIDDAGRWGASSATSRDPIRNGEHSRRKPRR